MRPLATRAVADRAARAPRGHLVELLDRTLLDERGGALEHEPGFGVEADDRRPRRRAVAPISAVRAVRSSSSSAQPTRHGLPSSRATTAACEVRLRRAGQDAGRDRDRGHVLGRGVGARPARAGCRLAASRSPPRGRGRSGPSRRRGLPGSRDRAALSRRPAATCTRRIASRSSSSSALQRCLGWRSVLRAPGRWRSAVPPTACAWRCASAAGTARPSCTVSSNSCASPNSRLQPWAHLLDLGQQIGRDDRRAR